MSALLADAAPGFFATAAAAVEAGEEDLPSLSSALKGTLGVKGKALFQPLRVALTGDTGGPELGRILEMMPSMLKVVRLRAAAALQGE